MNGTWKIVGLGLSAATAIACHDTPPPVGELIVSIQTDVALPDSVDRIRVEVVSQGSLVFGNDYEVGAGKLLVPATLGLLAGSTPSVPISVRVIAKKNGTVKMLREVTTPIPADRIISLRIPIRWLCDDSGKETSPGTFVNTTCPSGQTCIAGDCRSTDHNLSQDDNGQSDSCFDVVKCLESGAPVVPDDACTIPTPADPARFNVGLAVEGDGICVGGKCFVVLDKSPDGSLNPPDGWTSAGGRVRLPRAVCTRIAAAPPRIKQVVTSSACAPKTDHDAACGSWSSVGAGPPPGTSTPPGSTPTAPPGQPGVVGQETGSMIASDSCPMVIVGGTLFWCTESVTSATDLVAMAVPDGGTITHVTPLGTSNDFTGPIVGTDRVFLVKRTNSPLAMTLLSTTGTPPVTTVGAIVPPNANYILPGEHRHAIDSQRLYFASLPSESAVYALPLTGGSVTRIATNAARPPSNGVGAIVADADPVNGYVYVEQTGNQLGARAGIARIAKAGTDNIVEDIATLPTQRISAPLIDGADLFYFGTDLAFKGASSIYRLPLTGGQAEEVYSGYFTGREIAVDGNDVYWLANSSADGNGFGVGDVGVYKAPKAGGATPVILAHEPNIVTFAVDANWVYYGTTTVAGAATPTYHVSRVKKQ